jgi:lysine-specific demethylase 8
MKYPDEIPRIHNPSFETFQREFVDAYQPVIITGATERWKALSEWTVPKFRASIGEHRVRVRNYKHNIGIPRRQWKSFVRLEERALGDYLELLERNESEGLYVGQISLAHSLPQLLPDMPKPPFLESRNTHDVIWIGCGGHVEPTHFDLPHGVIAQVRGRKEWTLFAPEDQKNLYPFPFWGDIPVWFSQVDPRAPEPRLQPRAARAKRYTFVLNPGDMLFSPSGWWHQTVCLDPTCISVTHFFEFHKLDHLRKGLRHPWHFGFMARVMLQTRLQKWRGNAVKRVDYKD